LLFNCLDADCGGLPSAEGFSATKESDFSLALYVAFSPARIARFTLPLIPYAPAVISIVQEKIRGMKEFSKRMGIPVEGYYGNHVRSSCSKIATSIARLSDAFFISLGHPSSG
jgi:hypothetical protein